MDTQVKPANDAHKMESEEEMAGEKIPAKKYQ
jgi:hypothetical protein